MTLVKKQGRHGIILSGKTPTLVHADNATAAFYAAKSRQDCGLAGLKPLVAALRRVPQGIGESNLIPFGKCQKTYLL